MRDKTRVMKNDQAQVLPMMDVLEWPIGLGCDNNDYPVMQCDVPGCEHMFEYSYTPRALLTQIAIHAAECRGVARELVGEHEKLG